MPFHLKYLATEVAGLFFREFFRLHGLPKTIVSDRDRKLTSAFWKELFRLVGTKLATNTSYHPRSDVQTKMVNKWIEGYLRNYVAWQQRTWIKWLHLGQYCYNSTHHMSIGMTPFKALYGYEALLTFIVLVFEDSRAPKAKDWIQDIQDILKILNENLQTT